MPRALGGRNCHHNTTEEEAEVQRLETPRPHSRFLRVRICTQACLALSPHTILPPLGWSIRRVGTNQPPEINFALKDRSHRGQTVRISQWPFETSALADWQACTGPDVRSSLDCTVPDHRSLRKSPQLSEQISSSGNGANNTCPFHFVNWFRRSFVDWKVL